MDARKSHLDPAIIAELSTLMGGNLAALARSFATDSLRRMEVIASALGCADADVVRAEAHSLKGAASAVGALALAALCSDLERRMRSGETPALALSREIEAERRAVCSELERLFTGAH